MSSLPRDEDIFAEALALPADEVPAFLDRACAADTAQRARIEALLHADKQATGFMLAAPARVLARDLKKLPPPDEILGQRIGRYNLIEKIGEGGCGVVYLAEQKEPVRRCVALKVIKLGMDTKEVITRFQAERQALALMDHPNIAKVFDAGATEAGRPYFVMELVAGTRITTFCDEHNLSTPERLELFVQVCQAIQHAHQKGIIHRDIKPSNILVARHDGRPVPKVIDFGIAKATQGRLTEHTVFTDIAHFMGTPAYMSPEQAELNSVDIDTRSDIYSLGVLLYVLIAGLPPFDPQRVVKAGIEELRRLIREDEPPRPSTRLSTLTDADRATIARARGTDPVKLSSLLRGDLDWIVMRCLEKDRTRRYETANGLASDIRRFLSHEPVTASPPSTVYRMKKLVWRHKVGFAAGAFIALTLIGGTVVSTWLAFRATQAEKLAEARLTSELAARGEAQAQQKLAVDRLQTALAAQADAETQRQLAESQRQLAESRMYSEKAAREESERQKAIAEKQRLLGEATEKLAKTEAAVSQAVSQFLQNDLLRQADGRVQALTRATPNPNLTVREALDRAAARVHERLRDQPLIEASVRDAIGQSYVGLGETEKALPHLERALELRKSALGPDDANTTASMHSLANAYRLLGRLNDAATLNAATLEIRRRTIGFKHPDTIASMNNLGVVYSAQDRLAEAAELQVATLELRREVSGPEDATTLITMNNLAVVYFKLGRLSEASQLYLEALETQQRLLGADHPDTLAVLRNFAHIHLAQRDGEKAAALFSQAIEISSRVLGTEHPETLATVADLAAAHEVQGRLEEAGALLSGTIDSYTRVLGSEHPATLAARTSLGHIYLLQGNHEEATTLLLDVCSAQKRVLGPEHRDTLISMTRLANAFRAEGRFDDAAPLLDETYQIRLRLLGRKHRDTFNSARALGVVRLRQQKYWEAEQMLRSVCYQDLDDNAVEGLTAEAREAQLLEITGLLASLYADSGDDVQASEWNERFFRFNRRFVRMPAMPADVRSDWSKEESIPGFSTGPKKTSEPSTSKPPTTNQYTAKPTPGNPLQPITPPVPPVAPPNTFPIMPPGPGRPDDCPPEERAARAAAAAKAGAASFAAAAAATTPAAANSPAGIVNALGSLTPNSPPKVGTPATRTIATGASASETIFTSSPSVPARSTSAPPGTSGRRTGDNTTAATNATQNSSGVAGTRASKGSSSGTTATPSTGTSTPRSTSSGSTGSSSTPRSSPPASTPSTTSTSSSTTSTRSSSTTSSSTGSSSSTTRSTTSNKTTTPQ